MKTGWAASTKRLSNPGSLVWSAFGPREDEKRPQSVRTSERRKPKGHKDYSQIACVARTPGF
jgi:hypothetical protein